MTVTASKSAIITALAALIVSINSPYPARAAGPATVTYSYDSNGRLVSNSATVGNSSAYNYDAANNRTSANTN